MPKPSAFVEFVLESLQPLGIVDARAMFGGWNVMLDGLTFGLIVDDELYLKVDAHNLADFKAAKLEPFTYQKGDQTVAMSYRHAPDCLEDWESFEPWVLGALNAARRAKTSAARKTK